MQFSVKTLNTLFISVFAFCWVLGGFGCGSKEAQREKIAGARKYMDEKSAAANYAFQTATPKPTAAPPELETIQPQVAMSISNPVYLKNNIDEWASMSVPHKRLATRGEILILWDTGALKGLNFSTAYIWTASELSDGEVWVFDTIAGDLKTAEKSGAFSAVFVDDIR